MSDVDINTSRPKRRGELGDLIEYNWAPTHVQIRKHKGFAPGIVFPREPERLRSNGERTLQLAQPHDWATGDLPCVVPVDDWTTIREGRHWDTGDAEEASRMCDGCPVREKCLASALEEERGQGVQYRSLVRGGYTPAGRWSLEQAQTG